MCMYVYACIYVYIMYTYKVRWSMVPEGFISARLQQHPLVVRFGSRPELQQVLLHAPGVPRIYI